MHKTVLKPFLNSCSDNRKSKIENLKSIVVVAIGVAFAMCGVVAQAGQAKIYRVGVLLPGEPWYENIDGLRVGLRQLRFEEGKQYVLAIPLCQDRCRIGK